MKIVMPSLKFECPVKKNLCCTIVLITKYGKKLLSGYVFNYKSVNFKQIAKAKRK